MNLRRSPLLGKCSRVLRLHHHPDDVSLFGANKTLGLGVANATNDGAKNLDMFSD